MLSSRVSQKVPKLSPFLLFRPLPKIQRRILSTVPQASLKQLVVVKEEQKKEAATVVEFKKGQRFVGAVPLKQITPQDRIVMLYSPSVLNSSQEVKSSIGKNLGLYRLEVDAEGVLLNAKPSSNRFFSCFIDPSLLTVKMPTLHFDSEEVASRVQFRRG